MLLPLPPRLPLPGTDSADQDFVGHRVRFEVPRAVSEALAARAQTLGVTVFACLHAAVAWMLAEWTAEPDVVIGVPFTGRVHPALQGVVGPLLNPLPIRTRVGSNFDELARATSKALQRAIIDEVPFETLVHELGVELVPSHSPLFQVLLTFNAGTRIRAQLPGCSSEALFPTKYPARYDLTFAMWDESGGSIAGFVGGALRLFSPDDLRAIIQRLLDTLAQQSSTDVVQGSSL